MIVFPVHRATIQLAVAVVTAVIARGEVSSMGGNTFTFTSEELYALQCAVLARVHHLEHCRNLAEEAQKAQDVQFLKEILNTLFSVQVKIGAFALVMDFDTEGGESDAL